MKMPPSTRHVLASLESHCDRLPGFDFGPGRAVEADLQRVSP